ncbi:hypothetical protein [Halomonas alkalisoli]|uniref:hypothetical protein n=1 Tax=Halomonas alkalisoli TaxID=2907158 RepID=UPI001F347A42|nr:hypothetical protein [Halomonas alkalisoli]MCE9683588.1 hypothetical protein [Halomonas alkalisoli]
MIVGIGTDLVAGEARCETALARHAVRFAQRLLGVASIHRFLSDEAEPALAVVAPED